MTPVTQVQSQGGTTSKLIRLVTLDDESQDKPSTSHTELTDADMQKIEEEMMNLGEGTQLETSKVINELILEAIPERITESEDDDDDKTTEIQEMEIEEEVIQEQSSFTMSIDDSNITNTLPPNLTKHEPVKDDKMDVEETSQEDSSQDQMEVCPVVETRSQGTQEESSVSLVAVGIGVTESASQETQGSDQVELPETIGELDPQTGIFSVNSSLQGM